uniref:terminal uridylyltransferase 4-like n=1 Tax=Styela clava TaxID=7725 RepID=UPI001939A02E|nr:terminal uridylyltransferase 4-like [Styela clava]
MASGGKTTKDIQNDDPSIIETSKGGRQTNSQHGSRSAGNINSKQNSTPHNSSRKQQHPQRSQTPNSNEKRRQEHWKVPHGNNRHSPLARDLFGAESNPPFKFDFQVNNGEYQGGYPRRNHGYPNDHYSGGYYSRNNQNRPKKNNYQQRQNQNAGRVESQSSKGNYQHQNGGTPQTKGQTGEATPKLSNSAPNMTESDRKVQFLETLMKNGEKAKNLTVTVTTGKTEKEETQIGQSSFLSDAIGGGKSQTQNSAPSTSSSTTKPPIKSPADKFVNPLISNDLEEIKSDTRKKEIKQAEDKSVVNNANVNNKETTADIEFNENPTEIDKAENTEKKKKRRRNREKKKKRDKASDKQQQDKIEKLDFKVASPTDDKNKSETEVDDEISDTLVDSTTKNEMNETLEEKESSIQKNKEISRKDGNVEKPATPSLTTEKDEKQKVEELGLLQAESRLEKDLIFRLKKKSATFPDAKYFCRLCSHHLNTIQLAHKHIKDKRHKKEGKAKQQDELLRQLKTPPKAALKVLDRLLVSVVEKNMMSLEDAEERMNVVTRLDEIVQEKLPGCRVVPYGSSVTKIGLKTSDINVDIQYAGTLSTPAVLLSLLKILKECDSFIDIQEEFTAKVPRIEITDKQTNVRCSLSHNNSKALQTTRLLKIYGQIEPTVIKLAMLLRLWGRLCQVDCQQEGSLAPHSFLLMTIYYLQQNYGLPILHEIMASHDIDSLLGGSGYDEDILVQNGEGEWCYNPTVPPSGKEEQKTPEVEEEIDDIAEYTDSDEDIGITFSESPKKGATFLGFENSLESDAGKNNNPLVPVTLGRCFDGKAPPSLAELWLGILKFYSAQYDMENLIITIRKSGRVTRSERGWSHRRIAIEDPCSPKWNMCKLMNSQTLFSYFQTCLKHCVFYFHTAHNSAKTRNKKILPEGVAKNQQSATKNSIKTTEEFADKIIKSAFDEVKVQMSRMNKDSSQSTSAIKDKGHLSQLSKQQSKNDSTISKYADVMIDDMINNLKELNVKTRNSSAPELNYDSCYKFTKSSLTDGKSPVLICGSCKKEGHRKAKCPDEVKIKINPLPAFTERLKFMLDTVCKDMYDYYVPLQDEVSMRERVCSDLHEFLRKNYSEYVKMCLFGSSRNRFTFRGSDLDICMTFTDNDTGEHLDFASIIEDLAKVLRKNPDLRNIIPITTAKVPIVKFYHPSAGLEGDISLYNLLAQRNTSMLALYASIDERCRVLGYAMKAFVKRCCIGDASRGSLSSYAYTLLVIYFLQQRDPPVLPVLQELYTGDKSPECIVDGWNSWFYDSIGNLDKVWFDFGKNNESLGELWLGLLRFYTEKFDFSHHVASIRQKKLLTAFEKEWTSKCICIEDPFDLNHNLGAGVSRKMTNFIMKVFVKARERFGTDPGNLLNGVRDIQRYFFNAEFLMDGEEVPNDRCCRICGKIGHFVKDCPKRRNGRGKKGDDAKGLKNVECFACGMKGHFKKDCPAPRQGSPMKDGQFPHHPLRLMMPKVPYMMRPPMQNMGQRSPIIVQAKRYDPNSMNFHESRISLGRQNSNQRGGKNPQRMQESPLNRVENPLKKTENRRRPISSTSDQNFESQPKTPQSGHKRQQNKNSATPQSSISSKSPHPSSGSMDQQNKQGRNTPKVSRNLAADFKSSREGKQSNNTNTAAPDTQGHREVTPRNNKNLNLKKELSGDSPATGSIQTLQEVETQLIEERRAHEKNSRPKPGDNLNHLIPRQSTSAEEIHQRPTVLHGYPPSPNVPPFSMSPLSPPNFGGMYNHAPFSTSPRNNNQNPFNFARTPPNQGGYNYLYSRSPGDMNPFAYGVSPPSPGYGFNAPFGNHQGQKVMTHDPNGSHISSQTFVNTNEKNTPHGGREVHYNASHSAPPFFGVNPHHSYPPNRPLPQQGHYWTPNQRK